MTWQVVLGLLMMASMIGVIFIGFPISFTLLFIALVFGSLGLGHDLTFNLAYLQIWGTMKDDILPAVPLFIFMGFMTEQAGLMERLFLALRNMLAPVRGALYLAVILTATIFAMATGIVGAAVTVLGIMAGPIMIKAGYDARLSAGAIAAGGTLGILIPPSVMLVVMGPTMGVPVNFLYAAAFGPGFLLAALYAIYCLARSYFNPSLGPAVPMEERVTDIKIILRELVIGVLPLTGLIAFTLGTILMGLATATEAASCGAAGATLLALLYGKLTPKALKNAAIGTMVTSSMVLFLAVASNVFGAVFTKLGASDLIANTLLNVPLPDTGKLLLIMLFLFILGWPFEWPAIILVFLPICLPVVQKLDLGLSKPELMLWFGALVAVNLQTAFLSPPVAMSAYYLKNVVPQWSLGTIYRGMFEFMFIQIICLALLIMWPEIALWFPRAMR
ncbi:sialic acid TRAP transporter permease protein SiaT [Variibacter gotjawalensis]|uniref:Sialic acid TRAP transporter permease protein SiaT n=1 Tax=Variibacter gotjawalensis TaxID=1333996 RepID=A0A0S3PS64_9BRAD|nr:TRAP transporter large permease subunit [Variibacter gotjawalensis]NIK49096.1 tripartite ATP-independent transporter DctM subunit [Variibacter gotjawalensis]RZS50952.1 tripartite ATP-independent transporter DctM subunit [Variibacter gotjawalensis]BAT58786.1 sialic acid TRAP transporter permease protein SiaT [Variibacter gotjawalensis]